VNIDKVAMAFAVQELLDNHGKVSAKDQAEACIAAVCAHQDAAEELSVERVCLLRDLTGEFVDLVDGKPTKEREVYVLLYATLQYLFEYANRFSRFNAAANLLATTLVDDMKDVDVERLMNCLREEYSAKELGVEL